MFQVMKTAKFARLFLIVSCIAIVTYAILAFYTYQRVYTNLTKLVNKQSKNFEVKTSYSRTVINDVAKQIYILIWPGVNTTQLDIGGEFIEDQQCKYSNCHITTKVDLLGEDYTQFDAIVYNVTAISNWNKDLPKSRAMSQKYVFHSVEAADNHPVCHVLTDNYFNLTWTYKLSSDIVSPFFQVTDLQGNVVAPNINVQWDYTMTNITENNFVHLKSKRRAMIWIVDNYYMTNSGLGFAKKLQSLFKKNLLDFDIFGCDFVQCPYDVWNKIIENDYYFYFVSEEIDSDDYVTAEVLKAYNNYAVPVVYGSVDYKKFLPDGSYVNINSATVDGFVALIEYIIKNPSVYYSFHRWRNVYTFRETNRLMGFCELCAKLNEWQGTKIKRNFRNWWLARPLYKRCYPGGAESYSEVFSYVNTSRHRL